MKIAINKKWAMIAGSVLIVGGLTAGAAFAATAGGTAQANPSVKLEQAVKDGKLTQGQADVMKQLMELRKAAMEKLKTDSKSAVDQAVKDGKITQDQAKKLQQHMGPRAGMKGRHGKPGAALFGKNATREQVQAKLNDLVKSGKLTQEKADKILAQWDQHRSQTQNQTTK